MGLFEKGDRTLFMTDTIQNILILLLFILVMFKPKVNIEMRKLSKEEFLDIVKSMKDEDEN